MLFNGLIFLICIAPLHLGANRPISWSILSLFAGVLLLGWSYNTTIKNQAITVSGWKISPIIASYLLVCGWIALQCLDIGLAHPLWKITSETLNKSAFSTISVAPYKTLTGLMRLLAYGAVFWLSLQYCRNAKNIKKLFNWIIVASTIYALYGLYVQIAGIPKLYYQDSVTGTFINRNSYATYAGMCAILTLAMLIKTAMSGTAHLRKKQKLSAIITNVSTSGYKYLIPFIIAVFAILLTHSRAGLLSFILGVTVFLIAFSRNRKKHYLLFATLSFIILGVFVGGGDTIERFSDIPKSIGGRTTIYKVTLNAIADMPYVGSGYNSFEEIFKLYKDSSISSAVLKRIDHAHNTYLENILELGIPAFSLLIFCFVYIFYTCSRGVFIRKRNVIYPATGVAITVLVGFHSLFDFSMEMPAVAILYAGVMGACCSQSWSTREE